MLAIERRVEQEHVPDLSALDPKHAAKRPTLSIAEGAAEQRALRHLVRNREQRAGQPVRCESSRGGAAMSAAPEMTPRFGRRAQAQAALQAANQALAQLPPTPDEFKQHAKTMERQAAAAASKTQQEEEKAERLARQVQQLYAELQRKDREIARLSSEKMQVDDRYRKAELERINAELGQKQSGAKPPMDEAISALCLVVDAGPRFEKELKDFVVSKVEAKRLMDMRRDMQALNPFNQQRKEKDSMKDEVLKRVRDVVYRKGVEIRRVFRQLDEDKTGVLDHEQFRTGLNKMGAYVSDEEWEILLDVVDVNRDGMIQYIEFAETMKVNDVQMSFLAGPAPYANAQEWHGKAHDKQDRQGRGGNLQVGGAAAQVQVRTEAKTGYGLGLLPKHDVLRRLAEQIELKHKQVGRAFMAYDTDKDGSIDRSEFKHMLHDIGIHLNEQEFTKLMRRIDKNDDGSVDLVEWWKQFHTEATSGMPGAAGGIAGASWHMENDHKHEARGMHKAHGLDPFAD